MLVYIVRTTNGVNLLKQIFLQLFFMAADERIYAMSQHILLLLYVVSFRMQSYEYNFTAKMLPYLLRYENEIKKRFV